MIDVNLFLKLAEVFPDSFRVIREHEEIEYVPTPFGIEKVHTGNFKTVSLAECILYTAQAITHDGTDIDRGMRFVEAYGNKALQESEIKKFK